MTLKELKKVVEMAEKYGSDDTKVYVRKRNSRKRVEIDDMFFATVFYEGSQETLIEVVIK